MDTSIIIEKILLGITLAASIGPVSIEVIRMGLDKGFWPAFKVSVGGVIGDTLFLIIFYLGIYHLLINDVISVSIGILGALYLMIIGVKNLKIKDTNLSNTMVKFKFITKLSDVSRGVVLAIFNPISIMFWFGVFSTSFNASTVGIESFLEDIFIIVGVIIWFASLSTFVAIGHKYVNNKMILNINRISGVLLILFSLKYLWANLMKIIY